MKIRITINKEKYLTSLAKDFTSLGTLGFLFWFNYNFIGGSYIVNFLIFMLILLYIVKINILKEEDQITYFNVSQDALDKINSILNEDQKEKEKEKEKNK